MSRPDRHALELELAELLTELRAELAALRRDRGDVFDVPAVCARYRLRDPRPARELMRETGGAFTIGRRLLVHRATLEAWERALAGEPAELEEPAARPAARSRRRGGAPVLPADFWQAGRE